MSSLRNAVQRRNHRERAQPEERAKWGLLEKRKDYKLRAADHKLKRRKINTLKQKASERNEDEFYFGMMSSTSKGGIKNSKRGEANSGGGGKVLSVDVVKLMKTQDQGYLQTMLQRTKNEIERIQQEVTMGQKGVKMTTDNSSRIVFDDDGEVSTQQNSKPHEVVDFDDMDLADMDEDFDDEQDSLSEDEDLTPEQRVAKEKQRHVLDVKRRKLAALREQEEQLATALDQVDEQRARMNGTIGGTNKNGTKFKVRERKR